MRYYVATLQGFHAPFALVRTSEGSWDAAFNPAQLSLVHAAVADQCGDLPIACLARQDNGYTFRAPDSIRDEVGLVLEDLQSSNIDWRPLPVRVRQPGSLPEQTPPPIAA